MSDAGKLWFEMDVRDNVIKELAKTKDAAKEIQSELGKIGGVIDDKIKRRILEVSDAIRKINEQSSKAAALNIDTSRLDLAKKGLTEILEKLDKLGKGEDVGNSRSLLGADTAIVLKNVNTELDKTSKAMTQLNRVAKENEREMESYTRVMSRVNEVKASLNSAEKRAVSLGYDTSELKEQRRLLDDIYKLSDKVYYKTATKREKTQLFGATTATEVRGIARAIQEANAAMNKMEQNAQKATTQLNRVADVKVRLDSAISGAKELKLNTESLERAKTKVDALIMALEKIKAGGMNNQNAINKIIGERAPQVVGETKREIQEIEKAIKSLNRQSEATSFFSVKNWRSLASAIYSVRQITRTIGDVFSATFGKTIEFEKALSNLAAIRQTTVPGIKDLEIQAMQLGRTTNYTASEVVHLQTELAKIGYSKDEIVAATTGVLEFAQACNTTLDSAATVAGTAIRAFNLEARDTKDAVATMAIATTESNMRFEDMETMIGTVGPVASQFGLTLQDVTALMMKLRDSGMNASTAATSLRNIFLNLSNSSSKLSKMVNTNVHDFESFVEMLEKMDKLKSQIGETDFLGMSGIAAGKRGVTAFTDLVKKKDDLFETRDAISGVGLALDQMAATQTDNAASAIKRFQSAIEGLLLTLRNSDGIISRVIDGIAGIINAIRDNVLGFGYISAAIATATAGFVTYKIALVAAKAGTLGQAVATKLLATATGEAAAATTALNAVTKLSPWGWVATAISAVVTGLISFTMASQGAKDAQEELNSSVKNLNTVKEEATTSAEKERQKLERLILTVKNENVAYSEKMKIVERLNRKIKDFNGTLDTTGKHFKYNEKALKQYINTLLYSYEVQGAKTLLQDYGEEKAKLVAKQVIDNQIIEEFNRNKKEKLVNTSYLTGQKTYADGWNYDEEKKKAEAAQKDREKLQKDLDELEKIWQAVIKKYGKDVLPKEDEEDQNGGGGYSLPDYTKGDKIYTAWERLYRAKQKLNKAMEDEEVRHNNKMNEINKTGAALELAQIESRWEDNRNKIIQQKESYKKELFDAMLAEELAENPNMKKSSTKAFRDYTEGGEIKDSIFFNAEDGEKFASIIEQSLSDNDKDRVNDIEKLRKKFIDDVNKQIKGADADFQIEVEEGLRDELLRNIEEVITDPQTKAKYIDMINKFFNEKIQGIRLDELKKQLNWEDLFSGIGNLSLASLEVLEKQVEHIIELNKELDPQKMKEWVNQLDKIREQKAVLSATTDFIGAYSDMRSARSTRDNLSNAIYSNSDYQAYVKAIADGADNVNELGKAMIKVGNESFTVAEAMEKLNRATRDYTEKQRKASESGKKFWGQENWITDMLGGKGDLPFLEYFSGIFGGVNTNMQGASKLFDSLGLGESNFGKDLKRITGFFGGANNALQSFMRGDIFGGLGDLVNGITSLDGLFGGRDMTQARIEELTSSNKNLISAISDLADIMADVAVSEKTRLHEQSQKSIAEMIKGQKEILGLKAGDSSKGVLGIGSSGSVNHYINKSLSKSDWSRLSNLTGVRMSEANQLWSLTPEQWKQIRGYATDIYTKITDASSKGKQDITEDLESYIELAGKAKEELDEYLNQMTATTKENLVSIFGSGIDTMTDQTKNFANNFTSTMRKAMIEAFNKKSLKPMEEWQEKFAEYMENDERIDANERKDLQERYNMIAEQYKEQQRWLRENGYYNDQISGMSGSINGISEEVGDLLAAYVNAIRADVSINRDDLSKIANDYMPEVVNSLALQLSTLHAIEANTYRTANGIDDVLNLFNSITTSTSSGKALRIS